MDDFTKAAVEMKNFLGFLIQENAMLKASLKTISEWNIPKENKFCPGHEIDYIKKLAKQTLEHCDG